MNDRKSPDAMYNENAGAATSVQRRSFAEGLFVAAVAIFVDATITLFTSWNPLNFWYPPFSDSFIWFHGIPFPASAGLWFGLTVGGVLWILDGRRGYNAN